MDCRDFDEQVVRLDKIQDLAQQFVRVRLTRIEGLDLSVFGFDLDLTLMLFFLNADGEMYARYGQRDAAGPDTRQSLEGLRYTMQSVLAMHHQADRTFAPRDEAVPKFYREIASTRSGGRCYHCHDVKEIANTELRRTNSWKREMIWRFPLPDNLGLVLEVDRGNVVEKVQANSPAARLGMQKGDRVQRLHDVPIHSLADAQYALDRAPAAGEVEVSWLRDGRTHTGKLGLAEDWRRSDISWRRSMLHLVPSARVSGRDLTAAEKKLLGLSPKQLAFRQQYPVHSQAAAAGVLQNDVILGFDDKTLELDCNDFIHHVRQSYLVGDKVTVQVLREGKRLSLPMTLR